MITLLTDFGTQDTYVGVMHGVINSIVPHVPIVDLTHHIPPQDIRAGAYALLTAYPYFAPGTIHVAVVDPGVGTGRRPIAAHVGECIYVCPDNGLLTFVLVHETLHAAVVLDQPMYHRAQVSRTFHGRDIFAPVAAHLARGVPLGDIGSPIGTLTVFPDHGPCVSGDTFIGHIIHIDMFGNATTDISQEAISHSVSVHVREHVFSAVSGTYGDVPDGTALALFGSTRFLEIAVRNGSARDRLGLAIGDAVTVHRKKLDHGTH